MATKIHSDRKSIRTSLYPRRFSASLRKMQNLCYLRTAFLCLHSNFIFLKFIHHDNASDALRCFDSALFLFFSDESYSKFYNRSSTEIRHQASEATFFQTFSVWYKNEFVRHSIHVKTKRLLSLKTELR